MLARAIVRDVSVDLNDQTPGYEFLRWPASQLQAYLQEAFMYLLDYVHDLYQDRVVVELAPGAGWQEACECEEIVRVLGESTRSGRIIRRLNRLDDDETLEWDSGYKNCGFSSSSQLYGYILSSTDSSLFRVVPDVKPGKPKYVVLECYKDPEVPTETTDIPDELVMAIKQWMLWRALSVDSENNSAIIQLASQHRETYFALYQSLVKRYEERKRDDLIRATQNKTAE